MKDLVWWAGITVAQAKKAGAGVTEFGTIGRRVRMVRAADVDKGTGGGAGDDHELPADEILLGYAEVTIHR